MNCLLLVIHLILHMNIPQKPIYILPVGDSITQGGKRDKAEYTYRLPLQMMLHEHGTDFDFIGSRQKGLHEDATWPPVADGVPFDPDHEGYYGNKTRNVVDKVMAAFPEYKNLPDIVLIHLGTNDQKQGDYENTVGAPLREFVSFLLGHLNFREGEPALAIRKVVNQLAGEMNTDQSPVITVNHYQDFIANPDQIYTDTFDWAHPNLKGQEKMARHWFEAMHQFL